MITVDTLRQKAENRFRDVLRGLILGEPVFPLVIRLRLPSTTAPLRDLRLSLEAIRSQSRERLPYGYSVDWERVATQRYAENDIPKRLYFADASDYLRYLGKEEEVTRILKNTRALEAAFPGSATWAASNLRFLNRAPDRWHQLLEVVGWLRSNPFPGIYARQVPLAVSTKLVEEESALLSSMVPVLAPECWSAEGESFEERVGFQSKSSLIELRLLDPAVATGMVFRHFTASVDELAAAADIFADFERVLVVENHATFLTLPRLEKTLALMGQGFAVHRLKDLQWLDTKRIFYWGDIDTEGFRILAGLRQRFAGVQSVLMDPETFAALSDHHSNGSGAEGRTSDRDLMLHPDEVDLFERVREGNLRLEQEKIPYLDVATRLHEAAVAKR